MIKKSKIVTTLATFVSIATLAGGAGAWTVPNEADAKGNRTIRCEDGTKFQHHGTLQQAEAAAEISCKNHGGKWVIESKDLRSEQPQSNGQLIATPAPATAPATGSASDTKNSSTEAVRPGIGRSR